MVIYYYKNSKNSIICPLTYYFIKSNNLKYVIFKVTHTQVYIVEYYNFDTTIK